MKVFTVRIPIDEWEKYRDGINPLHSDSNAVRLAIITSTNKKPKKST